MTSGWFQELVDDLDAIVWEIALPSWRFTYVSERATSVLGYPPEQWLREQDFWVSRLHPDDRLSTVSHRTKCVQRGEGLTCWTTVQSQQPARRSGYTMWFAF